jgi:hypothetical protein
MSGAAGRDRSLALGPPGTARASRIEKTKAK